jgi:NADPH2:quinone reductase
MKAIIIREWTDPQLFPVEETDEPEPGPGEVRIAVHCVGVSFGETLISTGKYQVRPALPFVPGAESAGVVDKLGPGVTAFRVGDRVAPMGFVGKSRESQRILGGCREKLVAPVVNVTRVPEGLSLEMACLFRSNAETAIYSLQLAHLKAGETLLVLGAGGGTASAAVALGKYMGARVIASASSEAKRKIALDAGADVAIDSGAADWRAQVEAAAGSGSEAPGKVDVIYDPNGGDMSERAFRTLGYGGRHLVVGFAAGTIPKLPLNLTLMKSASVIGANLLNAYEEEPERCRENGRIVLDLLAAGKLPEPVIAKRYPLEQAAEAYAEVAAGRVAGRVLIMCGGADLR